MNNFYGQDIINYPRRRNSPRSQHGSSDMGKLASKSKDPMKRKIFSSVNPLKSQRSQERFLDAVSDGSKNDMISLEEIMQIGVE